MRPGDDSSAWIWCAATWGQRVVSYRVPVDFAHFSTLGRSDNYGFTYNAIFFLDLQLSPGVQTVDL
eukprot:1903519-Prymnesium_polylepis.1